ncbi:alpha/beta hydrolase [Acrocarpospora macrocephala]|uniref:Alpha/beta hydrolase n=1 Tax=Acrocarpospora macrocephala TaxID=150177 RepID=A0A5M3WJX1_9ACTN|nr:alpha/beta hydrolase [Acrocarpospora macrocephala]GES08459.1 alpha/beta hydrolase [Acrocarpospora macrocephala]
MPVADVDGLEIAYEIHGDGDQTWVLTPGGRFSKDYGGVRETAEALAARGRRVVIWDRPNCGASSVGFTGPSESEVQADALAGLVRSLDLGPVVIAGGSGGSRVSLLAAARHPDIAAGLAIWWISGGVYGLMTLGCHYCGDSISAAWTGGMAAVVELPTWREVLERNTANRERMLALDPREFIATMERWMVAYAPREEQLVPGLADADLTRVAAPTLVFRSGASDSNHTRATSEGVAALIPGARLVEPPWGDREWVERTQAAAARGQALFERWPLLVPQLTEWNDAIDARV